MTGGGNQCDKELESTITSPVLLKQATIFGGTSHHALLMASSAVLAMTRAQDICHWTMRQGHILSGRQSN